MVQNNPSKKKLMRVQNVHLAVKTAKTAKNRPSKGSFSEEKNLIPLANKMSYLDFVPLSLKVPQFPLLHLQAARRLELLEFTTSASCG
jgi:hypothetical protein